MQSLRSHGRMYRVTGASGKTGEDVEIMVEAYDEADAARAANRQGVFVCACAPAGADGSGWAAARGATPPPAAAPARPAVAPAAVPAPTPTFPEMVARQPVIQRLVRAHPELGVRVRRLNEEDRHFLSDLVGESMGISHRDSSDVCRLMKEADQWKAPEASA